MSGRHTRMILQVSGLLLSSFGSLTKQLYTLTLSIGWSSLTPEATQIVTVATVEVTGKLLAVIGGLNGIQH